MSKTLSLAWVMLKGNGMANISGDSRKKNKYLGKIGNAALLLFVGVYMAVLTGVSAMALRRLLEPAGLHQLMLGLYISAAVVLVFFFGVMYVISVFYHSSDTEKLLPLPLSPDTIVGAKLILTAVYEYIFVFVLIIPPLMIYGVIGSETWYYFVSLFFVILLLPVMPLCVATILVMLIMRFTPFARNKDRFSMVSGLLAMGLALVFVYFSQSAGTASQEDLLNLLQSGTQDLSRITSVFFPGVSFAVSALAADSLITAAGQLFLLLLTTGAAVAITLFAARRLYFKGVIGLSSSAARKIVYTDEMMRKQTKAGSSFLALVKKDLLILVRTPIFFMNNVLMNFLWPAFLLIPALSTGIPIDEVKSMLGQFNLSMTASDGSLGIAIAFAAACFVSGTNGITQSALSREGKWVYLMKIIPVSYNKQIAAKIFTGFGISMAGLLLIVFLVAVLLQPGFLLILLILLVIPGAVMLNGTVGIIFELLWPKLQWDNEQKAVKQNMNVLYGMLVSLILAAAALAPVIVLRPPLYIALILLLVLPWLLTGLTARFLQWLIPRQMRMLEI